MSRTTHHPEAAVQEVELLDAEIFEVPRRLNLDDARDETRGVRGRRAPDRAPFDPCDLEDD